MKSNWSVLPLALAATLLPGCRSGQPGTTPQTAPTARKQLGDFAAAAEKFKCILAAPTFETTPEAMRRSTEQAIALGNSRLDAIGRLPLADVSFANTVGTLDALLHDVTKVFYRAELIKDTSTSAALREAATESYKAFDQWLVGLAYRDDVYQRVKAYAETKPVLAREEGRLLAETMRDYKRAGLHLSSEDRTEVERLRKEEVRIATDFRGNINKVTAPLTFTKAELAGVPDSFLELEGVKTGPDQYTVLAHVTFHAVAILENAKREDVREKVFTVRCNLAKDENVPLLQRLFELRDTIARKLGYDSWADYRTEPRMAGNARTAIDFLERVRDGLQPKFEAELATLRALKVAETGDADATVRVWDIDYYGNQLKKQRFAVDAEELRVFFPYEQTLEGMFDIYQRIFGLKFTEVDPPYKWIADLQLYVVSDAASGEPLGLFYLDMFPRDGKYGHFAQFGLVDGKRLADGRYERPVAALVCNFPPPQPDKPSLLKHAEVETLFHEFGHAMHTLLTRAEFARFSGTNVPRDFVEAPSQVLENWVWDKQALDSFAADYRDPSRTIPADVLAKLEQAKLAVEGLRYRRQLSFGLCDMALHTKIHEGDGTDCVALSNQVLADVYLPFPADTAFIARFGHLGQYDAGYYGYAWADAIAADMATVFEKAPGGFMDPQAGIRLRREIYEPGDSRDVNDSIRTFLGRERSIAPFLKRIGVGTE